MFDMIFSNLLFDVVIFYLMFTLNEKIKLNMITNFLNKSNFNDFVNSSTIIFFVLM